MKISLLIVVLRFVWIPGIAFGQEQAEKAELERLSNELKVLRSALDSLREQRDKGAGIVDPAIEAAEERLEERFREIENKLGSLTRALSGVVFNPRTTAFINVAARGDSRTVLDEEGVAEIDNRPYLRSLEIDFRAPVDPYSDAVAILAVEDEAGQGYAVEPEEVYGVIKRLPFLEDAPLGLKLKFGKFRAPLGINNRLHLHDLPWTTRPLVISKFLGTEHGEFFESGFNPIGMDLDFFLPSMPGTALEANLDIVRAGEIGLTREIGARQPGILGRLAFSADWQNEHLLVLGASGYGEGKGLSTTVAGFDGTYKWSPSEGRSTKSFVAGGEVFFARTKLLDSLGVEHAVTPVGWYAYLQMQLSYWLYLGTRFDWVQEPEPDLAIQRAVSIYASYYTTEFLRFRFGFKHRAGAAVPVNSALFEVNVVFGSHPVEPYWVNR